MRLETIDDASSCSEAPASTRHCTVQRGALHVVRLPTNLEQTRESTRTQPVQLPTAAKIEQSDPQLPAGTLHAASRLTARRVADDATKDQHLAIL